MGVFNGRLQADFLGPKLWRLTRSLKYNNYKLSSGEIAILREVGVPISATGQITAPSGFETDLASVPRIVWSIIAPTDIARAATIHDIVYRSIKQYKFNTGRSDRHLVMAAKSIGDSLMKDAMEDSDPKVPLFKQTLAYQLTKLFGHFCLKARDYKLHNKGQKK